MHAAASVSAAVGKSVTFSVTSDGTSPFTYQWRKTSGGTTADIVGATAASYVIASVQNADAGDYSVKVSNSAGSILSDNGTLTIAAPATGSTGGGTTGGTSGGTTGTTGGTSSGTTGTTSGGATGSTGGGTTAGSGSTGGTGSSASGSTSGSGSTGSISGTTSSGAGSGSVSPSTSGGAGYFVRPQGVVLDFSGNLYVADASDHTIKKITPGGAVSVFAGSTGVVGSLDGTGTAALFSQPAGLAIDGSGNIFVTDSANATVRKITPLGAVTTLAGSASVRGITDGVGPAALFSSPTGIATDAAGNLYVTDSTGATVRKITPSGVVTTVAGLPLAHGEADGSGTAALFNNPSGIAVDGAGNIYVADTFNDTIRKITPGGVVTTLAGSPGISGTFDGTGGLALFNQPVGLAVDASGNVLVADSGNSTIRKITPGGAVTTLVGVAAISGFRDGAGSVALFNQPQALVASAAGYIFVADTGNALVREITTGEAVSTPVLSAAPASTTSGGGSGGPGVLSTTTGGTTGGTSTGSTGSSGSNPATAAESSGSSGGGSFEAWFALVNLGLAVAIVRKRRPAAGRMQTEL